MNSIKYAVVRSRVDRKQKSHNNYELLDITPTKLFIVVGIISLYIVANII